VLADRQKEAIIDHGKSGHDQGNRGRMGADQLILEARAIGRRADGATSWLLHNASLEVRAGERIAVAGPSGSGKTVLLRALAMIDPLEAGRLLWHGRPIHGHAAPAFRSRVIYLHQRPTLIEGTVEANLRWPYHLQEHRRRQFSQTRVRAMLEHLGRDASFLRKRQHDLSGGEAQVVALVRALQLDPEIVLLDEPTAALDVATKRAAESWLADWLAAEPAGRAQVWVTHDADQADRVATRRLHIKDGNLV
jgi:putative ABC transport system ATP-binding protein